MIAVIDVQFWFEPENRLEAVQTFLAEFCFILLDVFSVVLAAVDPFVKESGQEIAVALILDRKSVV